MQGSSCAKNNINLPVVCERNSVWEFWCNHMAVHTLLLTRVGLTCFVVVKESEVMIMQVIWWWSCTLSCYMACCVWWREAEVVVYKVHFDRSAFYLPVVFLCRSDDRNFEQFLSSSRYGVSLEEKEGISWFWRLKLQVLYIISLLLSFHVAMIVILKIYLFIYLFLSSY